MGLVERLKEGLSKTRQGLAGKLDELTGRARLDEDFLEELEEVLLRSDVGAATSARLVGAVRQKAREGRLASGEQVRELLKKEIRLLLGEEAPLNLENKPAVVLMVGVNGSGKTTTAGKLASNLKDEGKKVLLAAADTFRAAAIDQLEAWAGRAGVELIRQQEGSDPAAVAYDAVQAARSRRADVLIVDTAGRLQNKVNLMQELQKVVRVIARELPGAPHEVLLALDATTGQNALSQARLFREAAGVTGLVLTKLDGTAKGGVVLAVRSELGLPVKLIGLGERMEDLQPFLPDAFVEALFGG